MYEKIVIAIDGSELALEALRSGLKLAKALGAEVTVVTVTERWPLVEAAALARYGVKDPEKYYRELAARDAQQVFDVAAKVETELGVACQRKHVVDHHPAEGILEVVNEIKPDLIVIASHGRRGLRHMILGSVANEVVTNSKIPVLVVK